MRFRPMGAVFLIILAAVILLIHSGKDKIASAIPLELATILLVVLPILLIVLEFFVLTPLMRGTSDSQDDALELAYTSVCVISMFVPMAALLHHFTSETLPMIAETGMLAFFIASFIIIFGAAAYAIMHVKNRRLLNGSIILMFVIMLVMSTIIGKNSPDILITMALSAMLFLAYPSSLWLILMVVASFREKPGTHERNAYYVPLVYLFFTLLGLVSGAMGHMLSSLV